MATGAAIAGIISAIVGAGTAVYNAQEARKQQHAAEDAQNKAQAAAAAQAKKSQSLLTQQAQAANLPAGASAARAGGLSPTMLTGAGGVAPASLSLGSKTLLGS